MRPANPPTPSPTIPNGSTRGSPPWSSNELSIHETKTAMAEITLASATGDARVDALLREIVARFETAFPGRVRGYYVTGSYSDASSVATSDLDLDIVLKGAFEGDDERERARNLCAALQARTEIELDLD